MEELECLQSEECNVVLYGCETWSPTLREGHRRRVFENRVLRGVFGGKRDEITGECRKLKNEKGGACSQIGEGRGMYRVLVGKPEEKRPLGRPRCRREDNIKMDLKEIGCEFMDWIELAQDRDMWQALVNAVMNLWVP
jgi:hypothetical protein